MSLQGSTSGDEGGNHHTSVVSLAIVKGRIQHDGRDNGGRLSGEAMRKAQDAAAEVVVLAADMSLLNWLYISPCNHTFELLHIVHYIHAAAH